MISGVFRVNVQRECELAVAFQTCTLLVALERLFQVSFSCFGRVALCLLLDPLAFARDEDFVLAGLLFLARLREVAHSHTGMAAHTEFFAAELLARLLTFPVAVTLFLALVGATFQSLSAHLSTTYFAQPTRLVLQNILATQARLCRQIGALWAVFVVAMAVVCNLRVAAVLWSLAWEPARWRLSTAG